MLSGMGFSTVFNVSGGIKAWKSKTAVGPQDLGLWLFSGKESAGEILKVAYSLEQGLREFYIDMGQKAVKPAVKDLFSKLSEIEVKHQESIFQAYRDATGDTAGKASFEESVAARAMEGGRSTSDYLELFAPDLADETEVISLAMSIEAQALDLYQRVGSGIADEDSRKIVNQIANEEKVHLKSLGKLMDSL